MVCSIGSGKMKALARLLDAGSISQTVTEDVSHQKLSAQYLRRELREADEANLLDEEDMHIFGLRPMTDPLELVCCNACKKTIKASQYAAHAELCKFLSPAEINPQLDGPAVKKKPLRKERKKLPATQTRKATLLREPKTIKSVHADDIAASESHLDEMVQINSYAEGNLHINSTLKLNSSSVNPYNMDCLEAVAKSSSKPLKRTAAENPSNPGAKSVCKTSEVFPFSDAPAPLATKIYYSQRNHRLRRAICQMFFEEPSKESNSDFSNLQILQVNAVPTQAVSPSNFYHEQVADHQRDDHFLHLTQTPDQLLAARSDFCEGNSGGSNPSMKVSQHHMINTQGHHYMSNSYSFASNAGNHLGTLQQGSGSVPVV